MKKPHSSVRCDLAALAFLGPLEARVMDIVWARPTVTVRQVYEILRAEREIAYTTIMTILANLYKKGLLARDAEASGAETRATGRTLPRAVPVKLVVRGTTAGVPGAPPNTPAA